MRSGRASVLLIGVPTLGALLILSGDLSGSRITVPRRNPPPLVAGSAIQPLPGEASRKLIESYGKLPLSFEPCVEASCGSDAGPARFVSRGPGYTLFLTPTEAVLALRKSEPRPIRQAQGKPQGSGGLNPSRARKQAVNPSSAGFQPARSAAPLGGATPQAAETAALHTTVLRMKLAGANPAPRIIGLDPLPGKSNYFLGNDPAKWRTNVSNYSKVKYEAVYPGIDLVFYGHPGEPGHLEYDFVVAPGADPNAICLSFAGADKLEVNAQGDLLFHASGEELHLRKPAVYQEVDGRHLEIYGGYSLKGMNEVGFTLAAYDPHRPLVIDPTLIYSTYLGGKGGNVGSGIAVDSSGNAYVTGFTYSTRFPTANAFQPAVGSIEDAFVTKLNAAGSALVYSTYLGGGGYDFSDGIAVDSSGNAYVTGHTNSTNFPTANAFQTAKSGTQNAFVTKLNAAGSALVYSTYLGGSGYDVAYGIAVDSSGNAYVTGFTIGNFPITTNALQAAYLGGGADAFVTKLNAAGSALVFSTYLGGGGHDEGRGIAVDLSGNAYVTGSTQSTNFPTASAFQASFGGGTCQTDPTLPCPDVFVSKLNPGGSALLYSTYLGGSGNDSGSGIAVDSSGNAYVVGTTHSANFPTANAFQAAGRGAFVTKLNVGGSALVYSTHLGGGGSTIDAGSGIAVDSSGNAYVVGTTFSTNFPTVNAFQAAKGSVTDAFVTELNAAGSALVYSTYLGGGGTDVGSGIAVDSSGNAYVTGYTTSTNFPTANAFQATYSNSGIALAGAGDAFVTKFPSVTAGTLPLISPDGVKNNASYALTVAPGAIAAIFGSRLTDGTSCLPPSCNPRFGSNGRLNTTMAGAQVKVNGTPVPIFYSIPGQLGIQIPTELTGSSATVQVSVGSQSSPTVTVQVEPVSPGIFTFTSDGKGAGAFTHVNGSPVTQQNPAHAGELVILYATGLGQVTPSVPTGALPGGASATVTATTLTIDNITVRPDFVGLAGCCVGLNQVNVRLPANTRSASNIPVVLTIGGVASNPVTIAVQ
ncbi:MAG: hypothetical protein A3H28_16440 [Acidobacteria bacterium RIFCSPLOWO2_02_FULL_61_28]|nr:MAG: hypothetical protein A3H28_16440 [Acidobacteria bacterium RIFCSPLOWO2_02_FULL_61_28]